jgi:hypothetical protein
MNPTDYDLFAHATEFRLLLALLIVAASYALIQITLFAGRAVRFIQAKLSNVDASQVTTPVLGATGAR